MVGEKYRNLAMRTMARRRCSGKHFSPEHTTGAYRRSILHLRAHLLQMNLHSRYATRQSTRQMPISPKREAVETQTWSRVADACGRQSVKIAGSESTLLRVAV